MLKNWEAFEEIEEGKITDASFVANLWLVYKKGTVDDRYIDPEKFFSRTYITEGLAYVLRNSLSRVYKGDGDPVILLKTTFGGGKTHTLIGIYHAVLHPEITTEHLKNFKTGVSEIDRTPLLVAFDGNALDSHIMKEQYASNNLWQFLFYELYKKLELPEFKKIYDTYVDPKQPPGSEVIRSALQKAEELGYSVVFLLDEVPDFIKRVSFSDENEGDAIVLFLDSLARAFSEVRYALLVVSIPEVKALSSISEKISGLIQRVGRVATPKNIVGKGDAAHVLREALIKSVDPSAAFKEVEEYFEVYKNNKEKFSPQVSKIDYLDKMKTYYPFHPQYVNILYEKIASLEQFQSTRDILRLTSQVLHCLIRKNRRGLILLSDINMAEERIKNEIFERREGFANLLRAIETDMEYVQKLDDEAVSKGLVPVYCRVYSAIAVFSIAGEAASTKDVTLASVTPETIPAMVESAINTILQSEVSHIHEVRVDGETRYIIRERAPWKRLVEIQAEKKSYENAKSEFVSRFEEALRSWGRSYFSLVKLAKSPRDIQDDPKLKLVFLDPDFGNQDSLEDSLNKLIVYSDPSRGDFRTYRNSLVFVVPNMQAYSGAINESKKILAALEIRDLKDKYGLSEEDIDEITRHISEWRDNLRKRVAAVYNMIAYPIGGKDGKIDFDFKYLNSTNPVEAASKLLKDESKVIETIGDDILLKSIEEFYLSTGENYELKVKELAEIFARDPEKPYLLNAYRIISEIISKLLETGKIALRKGKSVYAYQKISVDKNDVIIPRDLALKKGLCIDYDGILLPPPPPEFKNPVWDESKRKWVEEEIEEPRTGEEEETDEEEKHKKTSEEEEKEEPEVAKPERIYLKSVTLPELIDKLKTMSGIISDFQVTIESEKDASKTLSFIKSLSASLKDLNPSYSLTADIGDGESINLKLTGNATSDGIKEVLSTAERFGCSWVRTLITLDSTDVAELLKKLDIKLLREKYRNVKFDVSCKVRKNE